MRFAVVGALLLSLAGVLGAQSVETPVAFDSARRVLAITPRIAERLSLVAPVWPVKSADYREARLYSVQPAGGFVLVVQRQDGALERFPLTDSDRRLLQNAVNLATSTTGRPGGELAADVVSEPAGNAFARHQTFLAAVIYAPLAASLATDGTVAGSVYLLATGATFFVSYSAAQSTPFTRAQNDLGGSLGLSAGAGGWLAGYAATGNSDRGVRTLALGSAFAGTIAGVTLGKSLTDAEAHAAAFGIENGAAFGVLGASLASGDTRAMSAAAVVAGAIGYPVGVSYPRKTAYNVTAGDIEATSTASLIGVMAGASLLYDGDHQSPRKVALFLSGGYLLGGIVGDQLLARPYDLTQSQANIVNVGAIAGAIVGAAVPVAARADNLLVDLGVPAIGAAIGAAIVAGNFPSADESKLRVGSLKSRSTGLHLSFDPAAAVAAASGVRGTHSIVRLSF